MKRVLMLFIFALFINVSSATNPIDEEPTKFQFGNHYVDTMIEDQRIFDPRAQEKTEGWSCHYNDAGDELICVETREE